MISGFEVSIYAKMDYEVLMKLDGKVYPGSFGVLRSKFEQKC